MHSRRSIYARFMPRQCDKLHIRPFNSRSCHGKPHTCLQLKMSGTASGGAVMSQKEQLVEADAPASLDMAAAVRDKVAKEAEELCASGQCAAAVVALQRAIDFWDSTSRALMAWLLIWGQRRHRH